MASSSLIGNLAVLLTMETAAFEKGTSHASKLLRKTQREFEQMGEKIKGVGDSMSKWITLPLLGAGTAVVKMAGDFETAMNNVAISTQAGAAELAEMKDLALDIGKNTTKSAKESAEAMDMLAKAGMSVRDILNGGARATVALAEAAGSDLEPAASVVTDTMAQFKISAKDLPETINHVTGAVNESKFSFEDFAYGLAQGGGVAASAGVEFSDFAAALAATSAQFASGQDAGTSMKTFLLSLTPTTERAAKAFEAAGFSAYTATGQLKPMAQIAEELRLRFGHLSEQDLNATFKNMFGTDAIRMAIGLMRQGGQGIEEMQRRIAATDAAEQAAQRMKGFNAELEKLGGAVETAAIAIADSGMLAAVTSLVAGLAGLIDTLGELSPTTLKWVTIVAALTAGLGPLVIVVGSAVSTFGVLLPLIIKAGAAFGILKTAFLILKAAAIASLPALAPFLVPLAAIAAAAGAVYLAFKNWDKITAFVSRMVGGVSSELRALSAPFKWVIGQAKMVGDAFFRLYDRVVGHSYVPDLVDGIRDEMARLDAVMVKPVADATTKAEQAFRDLATRTKQLWDELFPEAVADRAFTANLKTIEDALAAGQITPESARAARWRLAANDMKAGNVTPIGDGLKKAEEPLGDFGEAAEATTVRVAKSFEDMVTSVTSSIRGFVDAIKSGDILSIAETLVGLFTSLGSAGLFGKGVQAGLGKSYANRANGGPVFAGRTYMVGERGKELFTPSRSGYIKPNNDNGRSAPVRVIVDHSPALVARIVAGDQNAALAGAAAGQAGIYRRVGKTIP